MAVLISSVFLPLYPVDAFSQVEDGPDAPNTHGAEQLDTTWIEQSSDCRSFSENLNRYSASLDEAQKADKVTQEVFKSIIKVACYGKHAVCGFALCRETQIPPKSAVDEKKLEPISKSSPRGALNPWQRLDWLNRPLTCNQLRAKTIEEFGGLASYNRMSERRKIELAYVLETSCSERFAHCSFKSCLRMKKGLAPLPEKKSTNSEKKNSPTVVQETAEETLTRLIAQSKAMQNILIDLAMKEEKASNAQWNQLSNKDEQREIAARKEEAKRSNSTTVKPSSSAGVSYRPNVSAPKKPSSAKYSGSRYGESKTPRRTSRERPARRTTAGITTEDPSRSSASSTRQPSKQSAPPLSGF
jgi:hypothetical protein